MISPLLANLYLHYAFDVWLTREFPQVTFERYCDDAVIHCGSERQARRVRDALALRLAQVGLELHPDKTRIVCFHQPGTPECEAWVAGHLTTILHGQAARAVAEITAQADHGGLRGTSREGADACIRYLTGHADRLHYDTALACGWPIATGAIEGACRHIIADRLAITGSRWGLAGSEAILKLRALKDNGDFEEYWQHHLAREHERLYPTTDRHDYHLTA